MSYLSRRHLIAGATVVVVPVAPILLADPIFAMIDRERATQRLVDEASAVLSAAEAQAPKISLDCIEGHDWSGNGYRLKSRAEITDYMEARRKFIFAGPDTPFARRIDAFEAHLHAEWDRVESARAEYDRLGIVRLEEEFDAVDSVNFAAQTAVLETVPVTLEGMAALIAMTEAISKNCSSDDRVHLGIASLSKAAKTLLPSNRHMGA